nr:protein argonaute 1-like [Tanacetum cinerariifolium]
MLLDEDDGSGINKSLCLGYLISIEYEFEHVFEYILGERERDFKVVIKFSSRADLHHLGMFLARRQADATQKGLQVLDIMLQELSNNRERYLCKTIYFLSVGVPTVVTWSVSFEDLSNPIRQDLYIIYPHGSTNTLPYATMRSRSLAAMAFWSVKLIEDMKVHSKKLQEQQMSGCSYGPITRLPVSTLWLVQELALLKHHMHQATEKG